MALKVLMLRQRLSAAQAAMTELQQTRESILQRESELEASIAEAQTEEELTACDTAVSDLDTERQQNDDAITAQQGVIDDLTRQIAELEDVQTRAAHAPAPAEAHENERRETPMPNITNRTWFGLSAEQRSAFLQSENVTRCLNDLRAMRAQSRAVSGAGVTVPTEITDLVIENINDGSKLWRYCHTEYRKGKARTPIIADSIEAIWVESVDAVPELGLSFTAIEVDAYKVCGYIPVPNSVLEDADNVKLATVLIRALISGIGRGLDRAIVYGTGVKMPVGFVTRIAAAEQPAWWDSNMGTFESLASTHVLKLNLAAKSGTEFFAPLMTALGVADPLAYGGEPVWIMSRATHTTLLSKCLAFNAAGAIVSGMNNTMPILGGDVVELDFIPDGDIAGGFLQAQRMVRRDGMEVESSDHAMFVQDQTVFRGKARVDGKPASGKPFVLVNIKNVDPATTSTFPSAT